MFKLVSLKKLQRKLNRGTPKTLAMVVGRFNDMPITTMVPHARAIRILQARARIYYIGSTIKFEYNKSPFQMNNNSSSWGNNNFHLDIVKAFSVLK